jgi:hypothetical protein
VWVFCFFTLIYKSMKYLKTFETKIRHNFTDKMVTDIKGIFVEMRDIGTNQF